MSGITRFRFDCECGFSVNFEAQVGSNRSLTGVSRLFMPSLPPRTLMTKAGAIAQLQAHECELRPRGSVLEGKTE